MLNFHENKDVYIIWLIKGTEFNLVILFCLMKLQYVLIEKNDLEIKILKVDQRYKDMKIFLRAAVWCSILV